MAIDGGSQRPVEALRERLDAAGCRYSRFDSEDGLVMKTVWHSWDPEQGGMRAFEALWSAQNGSKLFVTASNLSVDEALQVSMGAERAHLERTEFGEWPHDLRCSRCGVVLPYFTWYDTTGADRNLKLRRCPRCDRLLTNPHDVKEVEK